MPADRSDRRCILALEDGTYFLGLAFGASGSRTGEVVFNTSMTGYQEVLTDPSYCGQIVTMTYPLIGNYGVNAEDVESSRPQVAGFVVRELARRHSNHRASMSLADYLSEHGIIGIEGIDTRALTRKLRTDGAMRGIITTEAGDPAECVRLAAESPSQVGLDLVRVVAPKESVEWTDGLDPRFTASRNSRSGAGVSCEAPPLTKGGSGGFNRQIAQSQNHPIDNRLVLAIDCGMKRNILRHLVDAGCRVRIVPPTITAGEILDHRPGGVFVSNGPGDPAAVHYAIETLKGLIGRVPIFGICLGHQLLGLALGAETFKLKFGHRGANQPVQNLATGRVEITSQNHGFAVEMKSLEAAGGVPTHVNLNDKTLEGFVHRELPILAVQYHPEASPGPHDATYLFDCFTTMMTTCRPPTADEMAAAQIVLQNRRLVAHA
ncbi:MAG: glutamine-hydrolyzing carbamoyl-phosphate synthase small subunit [Phycisphaerales bacterium]|nr:glutamine-hydrolyzing carbamoyl-phosphate synthase small subunit [Phycisphaerales bacterium]